MRTQLILIVIASLAACGSKDDSKTPEGESEPTQPAAATEPAPAAPEPPVADRAALPDPQCDDWAPAALIEKHCGVAVELSPNEILPDSDLQCMRVGRLDTGAQVQVQIGKAQAQGWKVTRRDFPAEPAVSEDRGKRLARVGAFPYTITVTRRELRGADPICTDAEASALAAAIAAAVPRGDEPEVAADNPACDKLLRPEDFERACGQRVELTATAMEDGASVFCNRTGPGGVIFIVSRHRDAATASRASEVARSGGHGTAVAAFERYLVELKSVEGPGEPAACDDAELQSLTRIVLERLGAVSEGD